MKISKSGQYALLSVADLALYANGGHDSIANIAQRQQIEPRYLGQIFFALKNAGIVAAVRGKSGGYYLTYDPKELTAGEVVRALEGELAPTRCSADDAPESCSTYDNCITRAFWQSIGRTINSTLDSMTIADIINGYQKGINNEAQ